MIWSLIHLVDILLWLFMAGSVAYVVVFALASLVPRKKGGSHSDSQLPPATFLVLYPAYREDRVICQSVETFLRQDYPRGRYELVVISDHMAAETNERLAAMPITLLQPLFLVSSKARALQYAIGHTGPADYVVILDADNVVAPDFLTRLNAVCQQGYEALQCHRTAKNSNNDIAALDGVSEEINNTLFRRAHNNIGLSSALIGSGMCFSYEWFRANVEQLCSAVEDRELEALLMKQRVYIKYVDDLYVMDEKVSSEDNFQRQRMRWMNGQVQTLLLMLPYLPKAIATANVNYIDKTVQQMLIPRSILLACIPLMAVVMTLVAPTWSIKWWAMLAGFALTLLIAIPSRLRTRTLPGRLASLLHLVWRMGKNLFHLDKNNTEFTHTSHSQ